MVLGQFSAFVTECYCNSKKASRRGKGEIHSGFSYTSDTYGIYFILKRSMSSFSHLVMPSFNKIGVMGHTCVMFRLDYYYIALLKQNVKVHGPLVYVLTKSVHVFYLIQQIGRLIFRDIYFSLKNWLEIAVNARN